MSASGNSGGVRIFPDKLTPGDPNPDLRRTVHLVATIDPPVTGVTVWMRLYDVDDPFDQLHGPQGLNDIADVGLLDPTGATAGGDNRGGSAMGTVAPTTGPYGQARAIMPVSMQPGDNYRAAASLRGEGVLVSARVEDMANALSVTQRVTPQGVKLFANGDFSGYQCPVVWSQMLTVWRKLHVETDTMVRPTFAQNTFTMPWNEPRNTSLATQIQFDVEDPVGGFQTNDQQFVGGLKCFTARETFRPAE